MLDQFLWGHLSRVCDISCFLLVDLRTLLLYFPESRKKINFNFFIFLFYPPTLNIICFVEKKNIFLRVFLCIFEGDTVKSDCPMQENYEIFKDLIQTVGLLY